MSDSAPQWDKLFNVQGKVVLVTGGSRGATHATDTSFEGILTTFTLHVGIGKMVHYLPYLPLILNLTPSGYCPQDRYRFCSPRRKSLHHFEGQESL